MSRAATPARPASPTASRSEDGQGQPPALLPPSAAAPPPRASWGCRTLAHDGLGTQTVVGWAGLLLQEAPEAVQSVHFSQGELRQISEKPARLMCCRVPSRGLPIKHDRKQSMITN